MSRLSLAPLLVTLLVASMSLSFAAPWLSAPSPSHTHDIVVSIVPTVHPSPSKDHVQIDHHHHHHYHHHHHDSNDDTPTESETYTYHYTESTHHEDMDSESSTAESMHSHPHHELSEPYVVLDHDSDEETQHHHHHHHHHNTDREPSVLDTVQTYVDILVNDTVDVFNTVVNETSHFFSDTVPNLVNDVIPDWFDNTTATAATTAEGLVNSTRDVIEHDIPETAGHVASNASAFWDGFSGAVSTTIDALTPNITSAGDLVPDAVANFTDSLPSAHDIYSNVTTYVEDTYNDVTSSAGEMYDDATEYASAVYENVTTFANDAYNNLTEALPSTEHVISNVTAVIPTLDELEDMTAHAVNNVTEWGEHVYHNVTEQLPAWEDVKHNITEDLPNAAGHFVHNVTERINVTIPEVFVSPSPSPTEQSLLERTLEYLFNTSLHDNMTLGTCERGFCYYNESLVSSCLPVVERKRSGVWCNLKNTTTGRSQPVCCGNHDCCQPHVINISMLSLCGALVLAFMVYICTLMSRNKEEHDATRHRRLHDELPTTTVTTATTSRTL